MGVFRCAKCGYTFRSGDIPDFNKYKRCPKCKEVELVAIKNIKMNKYTRGSVKCQREFEELRK